MADRKITRYPSPLKEAIIYGTFGIPGVDEVCIIYEGENWTPEEMDRVEQRIIIPYMPKMSRCYLRAEKHCNFPAQGQNRFYGQYYNWRFGISRVGFEVWLQQMEAHHQKYSKKVDEIESA